MKFYDSTKTCIEQEARIGVIFHPPHGTCRRSIVFRSVLPFAIGLLVTAIAAIRVQAEEFSFDSPMYADPPLSSAETAYAFAPGLKDLWLEALRHPEADLRRQAADAIVEAHRLGMTGLDEAIPELTKLLEDESQKPLIVLTAARALVELDASQAAPILEKRLAQGDFALASIVEPALAKWNAEGLQRLWLQRIAEPNAPQASLLLAFKGLASAGQTQAADRLKEILAASATDIGLRLEAGRALGVLQTTGLEELARSLASRPSRYGITDRLTAAALLARHTSDTAQTLLATLATDSEPAVAAAAMKVLLDQKNTLVLSIAEKSLKHSDANVRAISIDALGAFPTTDRLKLLAERLDDVHPNNRIAARKILRTQFNDSKYSDLVRQLIVTALAAKSWRPQEQAAILAGMIDHEPTADRLVILLDATRPEVFLAAAWGLRKLSIPSTAPMIHSKLQREGEKLIASATGRATKQEVDPLVEPRILHRSAWDQQLSQLIQALGEFRYAEADKICTVCVTRTPIIGIETRTAAIWALGHIHAGKPDPALAKKLTDRLTDIDGNVPEDVRVRRMSAVSLGRMKAESELQALEKFTDDPGTVGGACIWAVHEINGKTFPSPKPYIRLKTGWFLEPIQARAEPPTAETPATSETKP